MVWVEHKPTVTPIRVIVISDILLNFLLNSYCLKCKQIFSGKKVVPFRSYKNKIRLFNNYYKNLFVECKREINK